MIQEKDFLLREVHRLTLFLKQLISKIKGLDGDDEAGINQLNEALKSEFDLSLREVSELCNEDLLKRVQSMNETHIEQLIKLIFELVKKISDNDETINLDKSELIKKNILIINLLDDNSNTFSLERMNMKIALEKIPK